LLIRFVPESRVILNQILMKNKIKDFLLEDIGTGDLTVESIFERKEVANGEFIAKDDGVICGLFLPQIVYDLLAQGSVQFTPCFEEGQLVKRGDVLGRSTGAVHTLLTGERVILNLMQRMSGIATYTYRAREILSGSNIKICDTRKTTPGLRIFDKYAVQVGGGFNHRFGLYDAVMLKDNHISYAGGIKQAVAKVREKLGHTVKIEVEIERELELIEAIKMQVDIIMFDNRTISEIKKWRGMTPKGIIVEVSGGISLDNLAKYRDCEADFISMGSLTHSVKALDISFLDSINFL